MWKTKSAIDSFCQGIRVFRGQSKGSSIQKGGLDGTAVKKRGLHVVLILSIATLILMAPVVYSWLSVREPTNSALFVFKSEDILWHSGRLLVIYEGGYQETLIPIAPQPIFNTTYARSSRNFTHPENWAIEYFCSGLNRTIGPIAFTTDHPKVLYDDLLGHVIELWFIEHNRWLRGFHRVLLYHTLSSWCSLRITQLPAWLVCMNKFHHLDICIIREEGSGTSCIPIVHSKMDVGGATHC